MLSSDKSDSLDDESDKLGSDSESSGTYYFCAFSLRFDKSIGSGSILGSDVFVTTRADSKSGIFESDVFVPTGVDSKGGPLLEMFSRSNSLFYFQI